MTELRFECLVHGTTVMTFDGSVLERFSLGSTGKGIRFHRSMIAAVVHPPDRKGRSRFEIRLHGAPGGLDHIVDGGAGPLFEPLIAALRIAGVSVVQSP